MKRKNLIERFRKCEKRISIVGAFKSIDQINICILLSLLELDFLMYYRIRDDYVVASSEKHGKDIVTKPNHETATGINISIDHTFSMISFDEINSPKKGRGSLMVAAVMNVLPQDWQAVIVMDYSYGFWEKMKQKYNKITIL